MDSIVRARTQAVELVDRVIGLSMRTLPPHYTVWHSVCLEVMIICFFLTLAQMAYLRWKNGKRERGQRDDRLGHRHPEFRYTL